MIRDFKYYRGSSLKETLELLDRHKDDHKIICGGQSLLILMRQALVVPENLIDIKNLKELSYIDFTSKEGLKIGATTTHREIENSPLIKKHCPILVEMEKNLASIQTRNWGTIGGNLAHGDPAGDPGTVLIALNATVRIAKKEKERKMPLEDFFVDYFETALEEGELLFEVRIPIAPPQTATVYEKFNIIKNDQGIVSVAISVTLDEAGISCRDVRIVLGAAASKPLRARQAEQLLIGNPLDDILLDEIGQKAFEEADPVTDIHATEAYRRQLVSVLTKKLVKKAWAQAGSSA